MFNKLQLAVSNPELVWFELLKLYHHRIKGIQYTYVMEEDWDILIVLDRCRYDLFEEANTIGGSLSSVISPASCTRLWLIENFPDTFPETVLVSANPQTQMHGVEGKFHHCERLYRSCWDDNLRSVSPAPAIDRAIEVSEEYPHKRLLIHLVQPHFPFIGKIGRQITQRGFTDAGRQGEKNDGSEAPHVWERLKRGEVDEETVWNAYRENFQLALSEVSRLLTEVDGKSILTSDHGNAVGEWGVYGHPCGRYHPSIVRVPWFEPYYETRRDIIAGKLEEDRAAFPDVTERLEDLGYVQS